MNSVKPGNGPKDWAPARPIRNTTLLTPAEHRKLSEIERSNSKTKTEEWLLGLVRRISDLKPEEYLFPQYAALVNLMSDSAYAMRYARRESFLKETQILTTTHPYDIDLLDWTTSSRVCDAILLIRPFVRLSPGTPAAVRAQVGKWRSTLTIDGEDLEKGMLLDDILVQENGDGVRKNPFSFSKNVAGLFPGCGLSERQEADRDDQYGVMLPNGSRVNLVISFERPEQEIRITAGVVAASYTTKAL